MGRRIGSAPWLLVVAAASFLVEGVSPTAANALPSHVTDVATDTVPRSGWRLFERRVLFSTEYLGKVLSWSQRSDVPITIDVLPPSEQGRAAAYARKYGIADSLALQIIDSALAEGIDPELGFRLVRVESVFHPTARSSAGSLGLTQLMPSTARALNRALRTEAQILDPGTNLRTGFRYLRLMIERYDGDVRLGLLAYNRGELAVDRALRAGRDPENGYSTKVLGNRADRYTGRGLLAPATEDPAPARR